MTFWRRHLKRPTRAGLLDCAALYGLAVTIMVTIQGLVMVVRDVDDATVRTWVTIAACLVLVVAAKAEAAREWRKRTAEISGIATRLIERDQRRTTEERAHDGVQD